MISVLDSGGGEVATLESQASRTAQRSVPTTNAFAEARELQWLWKTEAMMRMAVAVVEMALNGVEANGALGETRPTCEFAADDLPTDLEHGGSGIAGSVFAVLVNNGIIERVKVLADGQYFYKERVSKRPGRKDAKVKVFRLADRQKAEAFLKRRHKVLELQQAALL